MSQWWYTNPQPDQLGLTTLPQDAPIWSTINSQLAAFTWQTDPTTLYPNTAVDTDDAQYLVAADTATVTYTAASGERAAQRRRQPDRASAPRRCRPRWRRWARRLRRTSPRRGRPTSPPLGGDAGRGADRQPEDGRRRLGRRADAQELAPQRLGQRRPARAASPAAWPPSTRWTCSSAACRAAWSRRRTVTADPVAHGTAPTITIAIANELRAQAGRQRRRWSVKQGGATVASASTAVANDAASFTLPVLDAGTYDYTLSYPGDDQLARLHRDRLADGRAGRRGRAAG